MLIYSIHASGTQALCVDSEDCDYIMMVVLERYTPRY